MNDCLGLIRKPVRIVAAVLGIYIGVGGLLLTVDLLSAHVWQAALTALTSLWIAYLFLRAAITEQSPAWPD
jgi:hypothetical protein